MVALIQDPLLEQELIAKRRETGADRHDEVWEGVYVMSPLANDEHQDIATGLSWVFYPVIQGANLGQVRCGSNVSDRKDDWTKNYRCPDVAVFLKESAAELCGAFWYGGPDFAVEIVSPHDRSREKLDFYGKVNTRELLIVDRDPWSLELFRLADKKLVSAGISTIENGVALASDVVPLSLKLIAGTPRPSIEIRHNDGQQQWTV